MTSPDPQAEGLAFAELVLGVEVVDVPAPGTPLAKLLELAERREVTEADFLAARAGLLDPADAD